MKYRPLFGNILVKIVAEEEEGTIYVPQTNSPVDLVRAEVVEVGNGLYEDGKVIPLQVRPYMFVYFKKEDAIEFEDMFLIDQRNVLLIEED